MLVVNMARLCNLQSRSSSRRKRRISPAWQASTALHICCCITNDKSERVFIQKAGEMQGTAPSGRARGAGTARRCLSA